ncbi:HAD family hydrolase [Bryobacter aggregatus]|uniref:HAD family hydrolase n=1 Tax=Bryobacter aggregatus TaxID=360054 RepID=UPI0004E142B2|nr:HAD family hydrolase [Bryobacter aggregatus]
MAIPPFKAYLFDVDGTLLDSAPDICGAVLSVLKNTSRPDVPVSFLERYIGKHLDELFADLFPEAGREQIDEWVREYRVVYPARGHRATKLYPDVAESLGRLGGRKTTATTKGTQTAVNILTQFGLAGHFQHIQGTDGFPSKPKPDVLFKAMEAIGAKPEDCLMVGDSVPDLVAGKAAGVKVCAVSYGYGLVEELRACEPDYWIDSITELHSLRS